MKRIKIYLQEAYSELMTKVSWPSKKELIGSSLVVMVSTVIVAMIVFGMDFGFRNIVTFIYNLFL